MSPVLLIWVLLNATTLIISLISWQSARDDRAAVRALNGRAREVAADGAIAQEAIRVAKAALLLSVSIVPVLDGRYATIQLTPGIVFLNIVAGLILLGAYVSRRTRREVFAIVRGRDLP